MTFDGKITNTKFEYTYEDGGSVALSLGEEQASFEWLSGPFEGASRSGVPYNRRDLGGDRFLINWHELEGPSFATLVIDIGNSKVYGSALINYDTKEPVHLFDEADITKVSKRE